MVRNCISLVAANLTFAALPSPSTKRKAIAYDDDDAENISPVFSPKRAKPFEKPSFILTAKPIDRPILQARSPAPKLNTAATTTTLSAPAGRSPTRKRVGILNRRKTTEFTRVDPPKFSITNNEAPFSIAAALSGTIPGYAARRHEPEKKGWFFEIHEDTPQEMMTNLMEHSTCTLDISSDEETEARHHDDRANKENLPPADDISQSQSRLPRPSIKSMRRKLDEGEIDIDRNPLGDLAAEEFYAEGCSASDVVLIADDEPVKEEFDFNVESSHSSDKGKAVEELMMKSNEAIPEVIPKKVALFQPLEKAEEGFEVWESGSEKGD